MLLGLVNCVLPLIDESMVYNWSELSLEKTRMNADEAGLSTPTPNEQLKVALLVELFV